MCGIIGMTKTTTTALLNRLKRMDYRGYDSFGYAQLTTTGTQVYKQVGQIVNPDEQTISFGIGHTRWATHGKVSQENAHPHKAGKVTIVHNGTIDNYEELKKRVLDQGTQLTSETDSEIIAHLINEQLDFGIEQAMKRTMQLLQGTYAVLVLVEGISDIFAFKHKSPLLIGKKKKQGREKQEEVILASDLQALTGCTHVKELEENVLWSVKQNAQEKGFVPLVAEHTTTSKKGFAHYMLKEIYEQPQAVVQLQKSLGKNFENIRKKIKQANRVFILGCGSAYYAAMHGALCLVEQGIDARALPAYETKNLIVPVKEDLFLVISQSGETMDTLKAVAGIPQEQLVAIVNKPYSRLERICGMSICVEAGPEVAVASTKAFINQALLLEAFAQGKEVLDGFSEKVEETIKNFTHQPIGERLFVLGSGKEYPAALEIAMKIKEVAYIHAEALTPAELKHGSLALIDNTSVVLSLTSACSEAKARGAQEILLEQEHPLLSVIHGQLLAYTLAQERNLPIDKPRNLAKSVTV